MPLWLAGQFYRVGMWWKLSSFQCNLFSIFSPPGSAQPSATLKKTSPTPTRWWLDISNFYQSVLTVSLKDSNESPPGVSLLSFCLHPDLVPITFSFLKIVQYTMKVSRMMSGKNNFNLCHQYHPSCRRRNVYTFISHRLLPLIVMLGCHSAIVVHIYRLTQNFKNVKTV